MFNVFCFVNMQGKWQHIPLQHGMAKTRDGSELQQRHGTLIDHRTGKVCAYGLRISNCPMCTYYKSRGQQGSTASVSEELGRNGLGEGGRCWGRTGEGGWKKGCSGGRSCHASFLYCVDSDILLEYQVRHSPFKLSRCLTDIENIRYGWKTKYVLNWFCAKQTRLYRVTRFPHYDFFPALNF